MSYWDEKHSEEKEPFEKACMNVGHRITAKGAMALMCCVDGSSQSDVAFQSTLNLRRKFDHVTVFHAYRDDPNLQPATWRHNQLLSKFDIELIGHVPKGLFSLAFVDREGQTVNTVLHKNVDPEHFLNLSREPSILAGPPDLIVMGHHGRKGPKSKKSAIGSTADQALRMLHYPCLIIKSLLPSGPRSYIMAVNDSTTSMRGFDILMRFVNPRDTVVIVHFTHPLKYDPQLAEAKNPIKSHYEKELHEIGPVNSRFEFVEYELGVPPADAIVNYVNDSTADVFAIAPRASKDRSSITEAVVNNVLVNVLLCKN